MPVPGSPSWTSYVANFSTTKAPPLIHRAFAQERHRIFHRLSSSFVARRVRYFISMAAPALRLAQQDSSWALQGSGARRFGLVNDYLAYLSDRAYSPRTVEAYAFDLLTFSRWLLSEDLGLDAVTTDVLLRYLAACREAPVRGRPGGNVYSIRDGRNAGYAPTTINRRLAAVSGLFAYREMLDPEAKNPVPRGREARRLAKGERSGMLRHLARRPVSVQGSGCVSPGAFPAAWTGTRPGRCLAACAPTEIGRSQG